MVCIDGAALGSSSYGRATHDGDQCKYLASSMSSSSPKMPDSSEVTRKSAPAPSLGGVQDAARASSSLTLSFAIKISASMCHVVAMRSGWPAGGRREQHNPLLDASIHHRASCCDQEKLGTKCGGGVHVEHHLPPGICSSVRGVWQQPKEARAEEMCSITPNKELDSEDSG